MNTTISINEIESTKAFQSLNKIQQSFAVKRKNREVLTNALIVHRTTNVIPATVFGYNLAIVEDLIIGESAKFDYSAILKPIGETVIEAINSEERISCKYDESDN